MTFLYIFAHSSKLILLQRALLAGIGSHLYKKKVLYVTVDCYSNSKDKFFFSFILICSVGVVWHTGKVLACGAVGPRFNYQQDQGIL